jgi:hypothetical protein
MGGLGPNRCSTKSANSTTEETRADSVVLALLKLDHDREENSRQTDRMKKRVRVMAMQQKTSRRSAMTPAC